ncbi:MAG: hypothetical protein BWY66_02766 [bacterium ADurb.Bin374]|nr:MAG: hypothetical protein BWY66_02766 [bacterium ADurb.Bin374]
MSGVPLISLLAEVTVTFTTLFGDWFEKLEPLSMLTLIVGASVLIEMVRFPVPGLATAFGTAVSMTETVKSLSPGPSAAPEVTN